jgi:uncharacterized protein (TIGR02145 family)
VDILAKYLGGYDVAGGKLKETGTIHWHSINIATNESGFTALPGGARLSSVYQEVCDSQNNQFHGIGSYSWFWNMDPDSYYPGWVLANGSEHIIIEDYICKACNGSGMSVRCLKD